MIPLYTEKEFNDAKSSDLLPCQCYVCKNTFYILKKEIKTYLTGNKNLSIQFCSQKCHGATRNKHQTVSCKHCSKEFSKSNAQIKNTKSGNHFCCKSCAVTYNNKNKTIGTRRSKLEIYLEERLTALYPNIEFHFNRKDTINSELDIYLPSLKLAIELNGIFHYEPIYGVDKLSKIQNNDNRKFQACIEQGIEFCIVDTSSLKYFKEQNCLKFLNIISSIIDDILLRERSDSN